MATATTKPATRRAAGSSRGARSRAPGNREPGAAARPKAPAASRQPQQAAAPRAIGVPARKPAPRPAPAGAPPGPAGTRPARSQAAKARAAALRARRVFFRWLWLVYVPIGLAAVALIVAMTGILPRQATIPLIALTAWAAGGVWLIIERRRRMVRIAVPASFIVGLISVGVLVIAGMLLAWMGTDRLGSSDGPTMLVVGAFLLLVAGFAPAFRLADAIMRFTVRTLIRLSKPPPAKASRPRPRSAMTRHRRVA